MSLSLISQTNITSGSCLNAALSQSANVNLLHSFVSTWHWFTQYNLCSIGSSKVWILMLSLFISFNIEYKVVDFQDQVGHVTRIRPWAIVIRFLTFGKINFV